MIDILGAIVGGGSEPGGWWPVNNWGARTTAGETVGPASALQASAYFAAIRCISEDLAKLPLPVYRFDGRSREIQPAHPVAALFRGQSNGEMTAFSLRETMIGHALSWGNGYAEIVRDGAGRPRQLWPIHPSRVTVKRDESGALYYCVAADYALKQPEVILAPADVFHLHGLGDGVTGYSVLRLAAESLGIALAAQRFAASFYGNGANPGMVLKHPKALSDPARAHLRESWAQMYQGPERAGRTAILEDGMDIARLSIPPDEAQFLESRQFQVEEIARWFRMPPHKLQHLLRSTFGNIEHQSLEYVTDTLTPWAARFEAEADAKLLDGDGTLTLKHDFSALLRGDHNARANYYRTMVNLGVLTPNEVRQAEGLNPGPQPLDEFYMQSNMLPLDKLGEQTSRAQAPAAPSGDEPQQEPTNAPTP